MDDPENVLDCSQPYCECRVVDSSEGWDEEDMEWCTAVNEVRRKMPERR